MASDVKLTQAQMILLRELADRSQTVIDNYAPAKKLADYGLATRDLTRLGIAKMTIADAGRAYLLHHAEQTDGEK